MSHEVNFVANNSSSKTLIKIPVIIKQKPIEAVVDTGATLSFIQYGLVDALNLVIFEDDVIGVRLFDHSLVKICQTVTILIQVEDKELVHRFYVFKK